MTTISWTQATWNPTTGCDRVSLGCDSCYALTLAKRLKAMEGKRIELGQLAPENAKYQNDGDPRTSGPGFAVTTHPAALTLPLRRQRPTMWFVNSMSDLFHKNIPDEYISRVFAVMALAGQHTFQILTKRHARMRAMLNDVDFQMEVNHSIMAFTIGEGERFPADVPNLLDGPLPNVWLGASIEDQKWADIRIPALLDTPAAVRFLSCEPLLGAVDLSAWMPAGRARWQCSGCRRFYSGEAQETCPGCERVSYWCGSHVGNGRPNGQPISWVICGGESGPGSRPMHIDWARQLRDDCAAAGVPFHFKQLGVVLARELGISGKGDKFEDLPTEFQVRQYPAGVA